MSYDIRNVKSITDLISYFSQNLGWDISIDDFDDIEDISYDFDAEDVGLKEESFAKISSLRQLQPLVDGQKWGIFCVEFDSNRFEVSALRKILSGLIPRRRNSADHAVWCQQDLLFICNWGNDNNRTIGVAHFEDKEKGLPQIKMISCAPALEDFTQIKVFEDRLSQLAWPKNTSNIEEWRQAWSSAFTTAYKQTIHDSSTLTIQLAAEAQNIRDRILDVLDVESRNGYVHLLYNKFRDTLIHDMTEQEFADMYAQTVVYGLFSARCMDITQDDFSAEEAVECIPNTNPFLKSLMKECLGSQNNSKLSFDELEIGNVVELLTHTKTDDIISDFNRQTGGGREDPVIHFYESFLTAYDKLQRVQRGVYYTPQPIVSFIVRAVDSIIKNEFGLEQGLASTEKKKIKITRRSKKKVDGYHTLIEDTKEVPAIQVLDPATGTGTFIRQVILQIYENFKQNNKGLSSEDLEREWNKYVPEHLLPRINAFELMMAPYAVAHMKLAMVLQDTCYQFDSEKRLNVYLTNSLEEPGNSSMQLTLWDDPLAAESIESNAVKKNAGINIIIGNPPYKADSLNQGEWILNLMEDYKKEPNTNTRLRERNPKVINDDYVKFIRYAQYIAEKSKDSIIAYINPHSFSDNLTFRGMRWELLKVFDAIYILDLHGNILSHEILDTDERDENVFDIQQGVCIAIFLRSDKSNNQLANVYYSDIAGLRETKYKYLQDTDFYDVPWKKVMPEAPHYFFKPKDIDNLAEYEKGIDVSKLFPVSIVGVKTSDDEHLVSFDAFNTEYDQLYDYRPFDIRHINYDLNKVQRHRYDVMRHFVGHENYGLVINRQVVTDNWSHVQIVKNIIDSRLHYSRKGNPVVCPLFIYEPIGKLPNIDRELVKNFEAKTGLVFSDDLTEDEKEFDMLDLFDYVYAVLSSELYREEYKGALSIDFPRVPVPRDEDMFKKLLSMGKRLRALHLFEEKDLNWEGIQFCGIGNNVVSRAEYRQERVYINKDQYFENVQESIWEYPFGGYRSLQKWFKDRKGKKLTGCDIEHVIHTFTILKETASVVEEIDYTMAQIL